MATRESTGGKYSLTFTGVTHQRPQDGVEELILKTNDGPITARFHMTSAEESAVIWVGGGLEGPAGGMYSRHSRQLADQGIASLRLHYRYPNELIPCVLDTLVGIEDLKLQQYTRITLIGHSFGGAVVISAGALSEQVAISSQTYGTDAASGVSPRPLLLMHGTADEILPDACSRDIYRRAQEPKQILLYPGCRHGLDECRDQVDRDLLSWVQQVLENTSSA